MRQENMELHAKMQELDIIFSELDYKFKHVESERDVLR